MQLPVVEKCWLHSRRLLKWSCIACVPVFDRRTHDKEDEDLEHHLAAIQIQEMFRKRRAVKEAKHATRLPRPFVQQVFCGHRNSRTMVSNAWQFCCTNFYAFWSRLMIDVPQFDLILFLNDVVFVTKISWLYCLYRFLINKKHWFSPPNFGNCKDVLTTFGTYITKTTLNLMF